MSSSRRESSLGRTVDVTLVGLVMSLSGSRSSTVIPGVLDSLALFLRVIPVSSGVLASEDTSSSTISVTEGSSDTAAATGATTVSAFLFLVDFLGMKSDGVMATEACASLNSLNACLGVTARSNSLNLASAAIFLAWVLFRLELLRLLRLLRSDRAEVLPSLLLDSTNI